LNPTPEHKYRRNGGTKTGGDVIPAQNEYGEEDAYEREGKNHRQPMVSENLSYIILRTKLKLGHLAGIVLRSS
jgi:hypothetical protein